MINVDIHASNFNEVKKVLGTLDNRAPSLLVNAINRAAITAKTSMKKQSTGAPSVYRIKPTEIEKAISITKASTTNMKAIVLVKGRSRILTNFLVSPKRIVTYHGNKRNPQNYKAVVLKGHGLLPLNKTSNKPFVAITKNGVIGIFSRMGKDNLIDKNIKIIRKTSNGPKEYTVERKVEKLQMHYGPSFPQMVANEVVFRHVNADTSDTLNKRLNHEFETLIRRFGS